MKIQTCCDFILDIFCGDFPFLGLFSADAPLLLMDFFEPRTFLLVSLRLFFFFFLFLSSWLSLSSSLISLTSASDDSSSLSLTILSCFFSLPLFFFPFGGDFSCSNDVLSSAAGFFFFFLVSFLLLFFFVPLDFFDFELSWTPTPQQKIDVVNAG